MRGSQDRRDRARQKSVHVCRRLRVVGRLFGVLATVSLAGCGATDSGATSWPGDEELGRELLTLVNIERASRGLVPLTIHVALSQAAQDYACVLAEKAFVDHEHPVTGEKPPGRAAAAGYVYPNIGENLAGGYNSVAEVLEAWMESPEHRDNLLLPSWRQTGIGICHGGPLEIYWVQEFGNPARAGTPGAGEGW